LFQVVGEFIKAGIALEPATAATAVQQIVHLLTDAELPVRIFATTSLAAVMDDESVQVMLKPHVTSLLGALFTIIQQVISEETMATLATIIKCTNSFPAIFVSSVIFCFTLSKAISQRNSASFRHAYPRPSPFMAAFCRCVCF
jgi:hypothetical protein